MKLYTIYTDSHKNLYENYFLKTIPNEFEIISTKVDQECATGEFYSDGWGKTCYRKVELFYKACLENMGGLFVYSDVDIQFFGKIKDTLIQELGDYDIACQNDTAHYYCSGFFICRANERTLNLFSEMLKRYRLEDQTTLNDNIHLVNSKFLSNKFFTIGHILYNTWKGQDFNLNFPILLHHSNWVEGINNKIKLMDVVRTKNNNIIINIQNSLDQYFSNWRPSPEYPVYPPYHEGLYLEDTFYKLYKENNIISDRFYLPIFWTTCYCDNKTQGLQQALKSLNPNYKYFTVSQHDDAVREILPPDTICFNAGGNGGGIPIPLVCSPIKDEIKPVVDKRDIFCSFVGSITHPIRAMLYSSYNNNPKYYFSAKNHSPSVSQDDLNNFLNITSRSIFSLCPRGYGKSSFRLYEVMQLGSIPVFIYDDKWVPFEDEIDWNDFSVLLHVSDLPRLDEILSSFSDEKINQMQNNVYKYWKNNFTMENIFEKIINKI